VLKNALLVMVSLLVGGLLLEFGLRIVVDVPSPYPYSSPLLVKDERSVWVLDPEAQITMSNVVDFQAKRVRINASGTRHVPCAAKAAGGDDRRQLYTVGDSQTFGHGLADDETWPNQLQCLLNQRSAPLRVINAGVPATNGDQYLMRFTYLRPSLRPGDRIVIAFTWNDLTADTGAFPMEKYGQQTCPDEAGISSSRMPQPCLAKPKTYYQEKTTWRRQLFDSTGVFVPDLGSVRGFLETATFSSAVGFVALPKLKLLYYRFRGEAAKERGHDPAKFALNLKIAARIRDLAAEKGVETTVVLLPNRLFYDDVYYQAYSRAGVAFPERDYPRHVTRKHCEVHGLTCLSLFEALRTDQADRHNFPFDGHLNPAGAKAVAEQMHRWLLDGPLSARP